MNKFWKWAVDKSPGEDGPGERTLYLGGAIAGESWLDDDITPEIFREELFSAEGPVTLWINSPGGDCIAASQIYTMLMDYPGDVTVKIDGMAASAASVIAMAGTEVLMSPTAMIMIHNPATVAAGDHGEMRKAIEMLSEVKESIINAYEIKTGLSRVRISRMMDEETWMNARKAVELGFADGILEDAKLTGGDSQSYAFSNRAVQTALINRLKAKTAGEIKPAQEISGGEIKAEKGAEIGEKPEGRSVDELKERLLVIKNFM